MSFVIASRFDLALITRLYYFSLQAFSIFMFALSKSYLDTFA